MDVARDIVIMGGSLGAAAVLRECLKHVPMSPSSAVVVVLHRGEDSSDELASMLGISDAEVLVDPGDLEPLVPRKVYLAPPGYHLLVESQSLRLSTEARVRSARPSIDVAFESAARAFGPRALGVLLSGSSRDGAHGAARMAALGGQVVIQDPSSARSEVLPKAAMAYLPESRVALPSELGAVVQEWLDDLSPKVN